MTDLPACQALLAKLASNQSVRKSELKKALGDYHWESYLASCYQRSYLVSEAKDARIKLADYTRYLRTADMMQGLAIHLSGPFRKPSKRKSPDHYYELAFECLNELLFAEPSLARHLDRTYDIKGIDPKNIKSAFDVEPPRIMYHKRLEAGHFIRVEIPRLCDLKVEALEKAIAGPLDTFPAVVELTKEAERQSALLKQKLKDLKAR